MTSAQNDITFESKRTDQQVEDRRDALDESDKQQPVQLKSQLDRLSIRQAWGTYRKIIGIAMLAAFAASLDGYQINLNGSIVANKGFIQTMASSPDRNSVDGVYVSVWGGLQSTGQFIGQVTLPFATDRYGRKVAFYILWLVLVISVAIESGASRWEVWIVAKLFAGMGVGALQGVMPMYISELAPTQLRGFLVNAYSFWFVVGQLMAPVALQQLNVSHPYDFRAAIYTQWGMIGLLVPIFLYLPESPWWLVSNGKIDHARRILLNHYSSIPAYDVEQELERLRSIENGTVGAMMILKGRNGLRLVISLWPKLMQQFVGLSLFNTYATLFFQLAGAKDPFQVTVILACVQLISCILFAFATDSWGPLVITGYAVTVLSVLSLGIVGCFDYRTTTLGSLLIFFACISIFSTTGASAIGYAYLSEIPQQQLRAKNASWGLAITNLFGIMFSFVVPIMLNGPTTSWGPQTGFFFAGTGTIVCVIAWFILPEVAQRTTAEVDEMFVKKVPLRKFKGYVTDVQRSMVELHGGDVRA